MLKIEEREYILEWSQKRHWKSAGMLVQELGVSFNQVQQFRSSHQLFAYSIRGKIFKCKNCGKEFNSHYKNTTFCSRICAIEFIKKIAKEKETKKICEKCGKEFVVSYSQRFRKYCSRECWFVGRKGQYRTNPKKCPICGKEFRKSKNIYCSKECYHKKKGIYYKDSLGTLTARALGDFCIFCGSSSIKKNGNNWLCKKCGRSFRRHNPDILTARISGCICIFCGSHNIRSKGKEWQCCECGKRFRKHRPSNEVCLQYDLRKYANEKLIKRLAKECRIELAKSNFEQIYVNMSDEKIIHGLIQILERKTK